MALPDAYVFSEVAAIRDLLEPWMYVDTAATGFAGSGVFGMAHPPYRFEGIVKPVDIGEAVSAKDYRRAILDRAEQILVILDESGWQLTSYPEMAFTGEIRHPFKQAIGGVLVEPAVLGGIALRLDFAVDKPR